MWNWHSWPSACLRVPFQCSPDKVQSGPFLHQPPSVQHQRLVAVPMAARQIVTHFAGVMMFVRQPHAMQRHGPAGAAGSRSRAPWLQLHEMQPLPCSERPWLGVICTFSLAPAGTTLPALHFQPLPLGFKPSCNARYCRVRCQPR